MNYVFYDVETSGLSQLHDQILQFAAIHVDENLKVLDAINVRSKRKPEIVPSPGAMLITNLSPDDVEKGGQSHYQMIRQIVSWIANKTPSVFVGHNSVNFDEKILRYSLYKTLENPYLTLNSGNRIADTMIFAHAIHHHDSNALKVAENNGKFTFSLGSLMRENKMKFEETEAHDAMVDTEATLDFARLMRDKSPAIWERMCSNIQKNGINELTNQNPLLYFSAVYFGRPYGFAVTEAARNIKNSSEVALFDLRFDPEDYIKLDTESWVDVLRRTPKVIRTISVNKFPILMPPNLPGRFLGNDTPSVAELKRRAEIILNEKRFSEALSEALPQRFFSYEKTGLVEDRIYDDFFSDGDLELMNLFHNTSWEQRNDIVNKFSDDRIRELGKRLICEESPQNASDKDMNKYEQWVAYRKTTQDSVPWMTINKAIAEADYLLDRTPDDKRIPKIKEYIISLADNTF